MCSLPVAWVSSCVQTVQEAIPQRRPSAEPQRWCLLMVFNIVLRIDCVTSHSPVLHLDHVTSHSPVRRLDHVTSHSPVLRLDHVTRHSPVLSLDHMTSHSPVMNLDHVTSHKPKGKTHNLRTREEVPRVLNCSFLPLLWVASPCSG